MWDPAAAQEAARALIRLKADAPGWLILGAAHYRAGEFEECAAVLDKAMGSM